MNMKKVLCVLCALMMLCGCEKPLLQDETSGVEENGNLSISVYQFENTPFASLTRAAVSEVCTRLNFAVYAQDGTRVKQTNQEVEKAGFGTCTFQLEEGTYRVVVVAHSSGGNPTMADASCIKFTNAQGFSDTFMYSQEVTLGEEAVNLSVTLNRIVALCRFCITDDIPANVSKLRFNYTGGSGAFDATTGLGCVNSKQAMTFDVTSGQKEFDLYSFLHDTEGTIHLTVTGLDASGGELMSRTFDVPMKQNHITWVSGAYFTGSQTSGQNVVITDITVNTDWAGEIHVDF